MDKKKIWVTNFFMRNPYMKFQNISIHGSKLMLCKIKQLQKAITPTKFENLIRLSPPQSQSVYQISRL